MPDSGNAERRLFRQQHRAGATLQTGQHIANKQIPREETSPAALALLAYIPEPNIAGVTTQNFHTAATTLTTWNSSEPSGINQNLTPKSATARREGLVAEGVAA